MKFQCHACQQIIEVDGINYNEEVQCGLCNNVTTAPEDNLTARAVIGTDYLILSELGRGGMGVVFLTYQISLDRYAALKVLADKYANDAEFIVGFIKEARAAAKLNHPHIVQAYAVGEDGGIYFFAMENVDGQTMKEVMQAQGIIEVDQALEIIQQIAEALDYAWKEAGLVHRDIKPDNIMLTNKKRAKLADLGLARVAGDANDSEEDEVMGTPQYISPEQVQGGDLDVRSDIYSLGATFFHLITGRFAFEGKDAIEIVRKHLGEKLTPPHKINSKIPKDVSRIIAKMMAKKADDRYLSAEDLADDIRLVRRGKAPIVAGGEGGNANTNSTNIGGRTLVLKTHSSKFSKQNTGSHSRKMTGKYTGTHTTTTGTLFKKRILEAQKAKKRMMILLFFFIIVLGGAGVALFIYKDDVVKYFNAKPKPKKTPKKVEWTKPPDETKMAFEKAYKNLLKLNDAKNNSKTLIEAHAIQKKYKGYWTGTDYDQNSVQNVKDLILRYDEERIVESRKKFLEKLK